LMMGQPTLEEMVDFSGMFGLGKSIIQGKVLELFMSGKLSTEAIILGADAMALASSMAVCAYLAYKTVEAGVSAGRGIYSAYATA